MRTLRLLPLLLALLAPAALADRLYEVELILFRQASPLPASQPAPEDWASGATRIGIESLRSTSLDSEASRLNASQHYQVLLHQAWQQPVQGPATKVAISSGEPSFEQYPAQGVISLTLGDTLDLNVDLWVNQLDEHGLLLLQSERLRQESRMKAGELTYLDHGSLGALIRVRPL